MFVNHAHAVSSNGPSPLSIPFVPLRNVPPHITTVVVRVGVSLNVHDKAAAGVVRTSAAVADEADAAADEADAAAGAVAAVPAAAAVAVAGPAAGAVAAAAPAVDAALRRSAIFFISSIDTSNDAASIRAGVATAVAAVAADARNRPPDDMPSPCFGRTPVRVPAWRAFVS